MTEALSSKVINDTKPQASKRQRKSLPTPSSGGDGKRTATLSMTVASTAVDVSDSRFPLYSLFTMDAGATEVFMKVSKSEAVSLTTKQRYSTNVRGYQVVVA
ncbi:hypothetical protein B4U84_24325 [Westiellopsis prolifica IICB1]|nr:hypothetical protein B4U84_24325 [Westiellopsis prolifica IICB1]